jgi:hypothetical protein
LEILIRIMQDAKLKEKAHRAHVNYLEDYLCHGHQRSKIVLHSTAEAEYIATGSYCAQIL